MAMHDQPLATTIHGIFSAQAHKRGEAIAVIGDRTSLSYASLDRRSNQIARRLVGMGAGPGTLVGLMVQRSPETVAAMLGILKAGAAYVPFDPAYPPEHLRTMIQDSRPAAMVVQTSVVAAIGLDRFSTAPTLCLEADLRQIDQEETDPLPPSAGFAAPSGTDPDPAGRPAYVMYTSGSTGRPKGVVIPHRGVVRLVAGNDYAAFGADQVYLMVAPLTFDASTFEVWAALLNGAKLAVIESVRPSLAEIGQAIGRHGVTTLLLTSGVFHLMVEHQLAALRPLRQLLAGGDVLSPTHVVRALNGLPDCRLINVYGPTENTTFTCCHTISRDHPPGTAVPIGRAIRGTSVHVLDADGRPAAPGAIGQLATGGDGLALGYLNQPALTAQAFVPNPFSGRPGDRLYLTGDLVQARPDGVLLFHGRADRQVKISGKRVELAEIEEVLRGSPLVADAAVVVPDESPRPKRIVAYVAATTGGVGPRADDLRAFARARLPAHMVPSTYVILDRLPLLPSGKIDRRALPVADVSGKAGQGTGRDPAIDRPGAASQRPGLELMLTELWQAILGVPSVGLDDNFFDLGGTSLQLIAMQADLMQRGFPISVVGLFECPNIRVLARRLLDTSPQSAPAPAGPPPSSQARPSGDTAIAIIGMAGRFPGAPSVAALWEVVRAGIDTIRHFEEQELEDAFGPAVRRHPNFVKARAVLADVDLFDAGLFGMSAREAALTDPQHRVFLECAWEALEDAGYDPAAYPGAIGVFAGCSMPSYFLRNVCRDRAVIDQVTSEYQVGSYPMVLGACADFLATRAAYKLNLRGPALTVQTACSTSLVAIIQACQSLLLRQADMALAGAVSISFPQHRGYLYQEGGMVSADGRCRTFDAAASGTVFGSGAGVVLLKRLADARADGDTIHAVISGFGINNDGAGKVGFTAPSADGQAAAIVMAQTMAGVSARSIGYVECHGTATPLGDPIEVSGLVKAFRRTTADRQFCALGSVKTNVGHLDAAAGVTGLIKTALALRQGVVPPTVHFTQPNPRFALAETPFFVNGTEIPWPDTGGPRRAGVSAFGVGGTNAHVILEQAPAEQSTAPARSSAAIPHLLVLSARSETALTAARRRLSDHLSQPAAPALADVAHTLRVGRRPFSWRTFRVAASPAEAAAGLRDTAAAVGMAPGTEPSVAFLFPGQGCQYPGMGAGLYREQGEFRRTVDACAEILHPLIGSDLRQVLFPGPATPAAAEVLRSTVFAQPAIFVVELALARLWQHWGLRPRAMIGHSIGEFVAACLAGVFSLDDALGLIALRGRLMQALPGGAMLAVRLSEAAVTPLLDEASAVAAVNGPSLCVISGPDAAIRTLEATLAHRGDVSRRLHTSHAFHSPMMDPILDTFTEAVGKIALHPPDRPLISSVTGTWLTDQQATAPTYWARHARETVRFADGLATLLDGATVPGTVLLEVGPGRTLTTLARQANRASRPRPTVISSLPEAPEAGTDARDAAGAGDGPAVLSALGHLWIAGVGLDWTAVFGTAGRRVPLPGIPFEKQRYWLDEPLPAAPPTGEPASLPVRSSPPATEPLPMPAVAPITVAAADRSARVRTAILAILEELSGERLAVNDPSTTFLELGFDSLVLSQVTQRLQAGFGVTVAFRQLLGALGTLDALTAHVVAALPPEPAGGPASGRSGPLPSPAEPPRATPAAGPATPATPVVPVVPVALPPGTALEGIIREQLNTMAAVMAQQLAAVQGLAAATPEPAPAPGSAPAPVPTSVPAPVSAPVSPVAPAPSRFEAHAVRAGGAAGPLTAAVQRHIDQLVTRYTARTAGSKAYTQRYRSVLADPRAAAGFRSEWKEMVYPIVTVRSAGARLWDIDGNEYIDLLNGFGQTAFGHAPDFVVEAVTRQLAQGFEIGPQAPLAGQIAALFCELTGNARMTFCNTGSEAVMAAMRLARAVTGRTRIVTFAGSYHGQFDEVLIKPTGRDGTGRALPIAPGIPLESVANMTVLDYGTPESLRWIEDHAAELAAVVVETVQSRHPALRPAEFLRALRRITAASGTALVFDEVVTGFRMHPGGMQALFGIRADLATYGKVVGGGLPIGILAGTARFMDALDGGAWQYGDDSSPEAPVTFFAGTFVRHPLVLAAVWAVLNRIKDEGTALQEQLALKTSRLVDDLNQFLAERGIRSQIESFGSLFHVNFTGEDRLASLLFYHLRDRGIHIQEGFPCFLTTAHGDAELQTIMAAFKDSILALQKVGILAPAQGSAVVAAEPPAPPLPAEVPLTEPQTEVWLAAQLGDHASCAFNESISLHLRGDLNTRLLVAALNDVVARHDALRATFSPSGERMLVREELTLRVPEIAVDPAAPADAETTLRAEIAADAATPFDLVQGPLIRARIIRLTPVHHVLILTTHHIVCDGWSGTIILRELAACYRARQTGTAPRLPAPLPFRVYALAEARRAGTAEAVATERYWKSRFQTLPPPLDLPGDRPRAPLKTFRGDTVSLTVERDLTQAVRKAGARHGCTLFVTLLAAFQALIGRLTERHDLVVGIPTAGQSGLESARDEPPGLVGHCVNFLPVRTRWTPETRFIDILATVKQSVLEAYDHRHTTLGTLVRQLAVPRDLHRLPLAEIQFNLERLGDGLDFPGLTVAAELNPKRFVNFDLFLNVIESDRGLRFDCDYSTDLFDAGTVRRILFQYQTLLAALAADPAQPLARAPIMTEAERRQLITGLNDTAAAYPQHLGVHDLIAAQAARTPDRIAVAGGGRTLSYADLDRAADRLAAVLATVIGPAAPARIGVLVDRSVDLPAALLAVLKAGAAYVPLDRSHPPARLRAILADAQVAAVLTSASPPPDVIPSGVPVIQVDAAVAGETAIRPPHVPAIPFDPAQAAYVIFTSGTTGKPKGVEVGHRAVVNFLTSMAREPGMTEADVLVAVTTVSFDIAALELLLPLCVGARIEIAEADEVTDGDALRARIESTGATVVQATPTGWQLLLLAGFQSRPGLKMLCGGEALTRGLADALLAGGGELWNLYGPTETTIWSAVERILPGSDAITIGHPIANTQLYVLDRENQPVPVGVPGELLIGGDGLARGYWNRPDLTAEKFVPDPFSAREGDRLYRTGDLARRLVDGRIQVLGRMDHQVKVRGFRIELEEVEAVMAQKGGVAGAAVAVHDDPSGQPQLVGYYVEAPGRAQTAAGLRTILAMELPGYMVPTAWVRLAALPLTASGKLDRRSLPRPAATALPATPAKAEPLPPSSPLEDTLSRIWTEVLGCAVARTDDLFTLGADSIQVFRIVARAREAGLAITAKDLLQHPSISALARALAGAGDDGHQAVPSLLSMARRRRLPTTGGTAP